MINEKRLYKRLPYCIPIYIERKKYYTIDITPLGCLIKMNEKDTSKLTIGKTIYIRIVDKQNKKTSYIRALCIIRHISGACIGVEFEKIEQKKIIKFIEHVNSIKKKTEAIKEEMMTKECKLYQYGLLYLTAEERRKLNVFCHGDTDFTNNRKYCTMLKKGSKLCQNC